MPNIFVSKRSALIIAVIAAGAALLPAAVDAHGVSGKDAVYLQAVSYTHLRAHET